MIVQRRIGLHENQWQWLDDKAEELGLSSTTAALRHLIIKEQEREKAEEKNGND